MARSFSQMTLTEQIFALKDPLSYLFSIVGINTGLPAGNILSFGSKHPTLAAIADDPISAAVKWIFNKPVSNSYISTWTKYLENTWGIDSSFSEKAAQLILAINQARMQFTITSGYRSPELQKVLVDRFKAGDKTVYTPLAPGKSLHNHQSWLGNPASLAIDISTSNPAAAGQLARSLGIVWGGMSDPVHFAIRGGTL